MHNICIVDDDDAVRDSMRALLESHMMTVQGFASASELLAHDDLMEFDCFVVDYHMPGLNGLELLEALRQRGCMQQAIVVSALSVAATADRLRSAGVMASLMKPVTEQDLIGSIRRATEPVRQRTSG